METAHFEPDRCRPETGFQQQTCALRAQTCGWLRALPWLLRPPVGLSSTLTGLSKSRRFHFSSWMAWDESMIKFSTRRWEVVSERGILALKKRHKLLDMGIWGCDAVTVLWLWEEPMRTWEDGMTLGPGPCCWITELISSGTDLPLDFGDVVK